MKLTVNQRWLKKKILSNDSNTILQVAFSRIFQSITFQTFAFPNIIFEKLKVHKITREKKLRQKSNHNLKTLNQNQSLRNLSKANRQKKVASENLIMENQSQSVGNHVILSDQEMFVDGGTYWLNFFNFFFYKHRFTIEHLE